ncbi:MAG: DUF6659 family protein [Nitrosotalea sp.]
MPENKTEFEVLCDKVFKIDKMIRSVRVINTKGKMEAGGMREGLVDLEPFKKDEMLFMELSLRVRMRHEFDEDFGPVEFSLSYRGKIVVFSFPLKGDMVLMMTSERQVDLDRVPFEILKLL